MISPDDLALNPAIWAQAPGGSEAVGRDFFFSLFLPSRPPPLALSVQEGIVPSFRGTTDFLFSPVSCAVPSADARYTGEVLFDQNGVFVFWEPHWRRIGTTRLC